MAKKPTAKPVHDLKKAATDKAPVPANNQTQIHRGNIDVLVVQLLSEISQKLGRIAKCAEIYLKENANGGSK